MNIEMYININITNIKYNRPLNLDPFLINKTKTIARVRCLSNVKETRELEKHVQKFICLISTFESRR